MNLSELLIALGDLRRRLGVAFVEFIFYAKRNVFGFMFMCIQIAFIVLFSVAAQHQGWTDRGVADYTREIAPEEGIATTVTPSNALQVLFVAFLGQGLMYSYLRKYGYSAIGFSFLVGVMILEWGVLLRFFFQSIYCDNLRATYLQGCPYRDSASLPHFINQQSSDACTCTTMKQPLKVDYIEILKSNQDSLSTIITMGALIGKVSPVQLILLGLFQSLLYHTNRFLTDISLGGTDDMGGATVIHVFGALYGTATSFMIYRTFPGFHHPDHQPRYVSGMYAFWGSMWVWCALPAYNGFLAPDAVRERVVLNSFLGLMGSSGVSYVCSFAMYEERLPLNAVILGSLSGGIALGTPFSPFLTPTWALLIGCLSGFLVAIWIKVVQPFFDAYDSKGILAFHLVPGLLGAMVTIFGCVLSIDSATVPITEPISDLLKVFALADQKWESSRIQLLQLLVAILVATVGGAVTGLLVKPIEAHTTLNYFSDSAFWHVPMDFKKMEEERGVEAI